MIEICLNNFRSGFVVIVNEIMILSTINRQSLLINNSDKHFTYDNGPGLTVIMYHQSNL